MFLLKIKTSMRDAMAKTFDGDYPYEPMRDVPVSLEFPVKANEVPSIWVSWEPIGPLRPVGIAHYDNVDVDGGFRQTARWSFAGNATFTAIALSSAEADKMFDEMVSLIAFREFDTHRAEFAVSLRDDPFLALQINYHNIDQRGFSDAPGTPWGTDAMMSERTISIQVSGEFVSDASSAELLVPISRWSLYTWVDQLEPDPSPAAPPPWIG